MSPSDAINRLDAMQSQIIHGKNTFREIADVIRNSERTRLAALKQVAIMLETLPEERSLQLAHRILACDDSSGVNNCPVVNSDNG